MDGKYTNLIVVGICILLAGAYVAAQTDWEDLLTPQATQPVHMNGKIAKTKPLKNVRLESIPQAVFDSGTQRGNTKYMRYLTGNQKYVLVASFGGTPRLRLFKPELARLFKQEGYKAYYRRHIFDFGNSHSWSCHLAHECAEQWISEHCLRAVCIIHPLKKQAIIDTSADVNQLKPLLEKYKDW